MTKMTGKSFEHVTSLGPGSGGSDTRLDQNKPILACFGAEYYFAFLQLGAYLP